MFVSSTVVRIPVATGRNLRITVQIDRSNDLSSNLRDLQPELSVANPRVIEFCEMNVRIGISTENRQAIPEFRPVTVSLSTDVSRGVLPTRGRGEPVSLADSTASKSDRSPTQDRSNDPPSSGSPLSSVRRAKRCSILACVRVYVCICVRMWPFVYVCVRVCGFN